jgi:hypothetical protein
MLELQGIVDDFASLSLKDLLEARDLYHFHLINKANVVGTAIGRYLIRKGPEQRKHRGKRTFQNSEVRDNSWPCVLVLVKEWVDENRFGTQRKDLHPREMVPDALYLPDGRRVPVCVVAVEPATPKALEIPRWVWPRSLFGPGFPVLVDHQGQERIASIGCLVSDGHTLYALTSRHVCGGAGTPLYTLARSRRVKIGEASRKQVTRLPFEECYPDFPSRRTYVNLDVGLCEIADANQWTSRVYGLPPLGATAELNEANIRLHLINAEVVAHGAASGHLEGRILALFYRYRSVAGFDYVSDFLIAPVNGSQTHPGDSGTVWHLLPQHPADLPRPIAVEWGGQAFTSRGDPEYLFTLATSLSSVCKQLDVDVVRGGDTGVQPFWGQTSHYDIASFACSQVKSKKLGKLLAQNLDRISFAQSSLDANTIAAAITRAKQNDGYIPLADVPDIIWKNLPSKVTGGRDTQPALHGSTGPEHPTHFADIDEPLPDTGKTLRELCVAEPSNVSVQAWQAYYTALGHQASTERGLLPFRVWQHFSTMVAALKAKDLARFLAAAGTLSHYVGDACQPLHGSMNSDGFMDQKTTTVHHHRDTGEEYESPSNVGAGVHSAYESKMVDRFSSELLTGISQTVKTMPERFHALHDGKGAAMATVQLMDRAAKRIPPTDLIQTYVDAGGKPTVAVLTALWQRWGDATIATMADGARLLAFLWDAAWTAGKGNSIAESKLTPIDFDTLRELYTTDETFVPSLDLDHVAKALG